MPGAEIHNLWGRQGLILLDVAGQLYTNHLDGVGLATESVRGRFQPMIVPTVVKELCADRTSLTTADCAQCNQLLTALDMPIQINCAAPNREGWLTVVMEADGPGILTW